MITTSTNNTYWGGQTDSYGIDHRILVNNSKTNTDVQFILDEKTSIYAHSFIILVRAPSLLDNSTIAKVKKSKKKKSDGYAIEFNKSEHIQSHALIRVLDFCYSGQIDTKELNPLKAVEVMKIAGIYKLEGLHQYCVKFVQNSISPDNIFKLLKHCDSNGVEKGKQICIDYAVDHDELFTSASAEHEVLGFKLYQEVTTAILKAKKSEKHEVQLAHDDPIVPNFKAIYESDTSKDISFSFQSEEIKVHKAILLEQSPQLTELIFEESKKNSQILTLDPMRYGNITTDAFDSMFRFFYYNEQHMDIIHACQLFLFAREMKLEKLTLTIQNVLSHSDFSLHSILHILEVSFSPLMDINPELQRQLQDNGLRYALQNIDKIDFLPLRTMSPTIGMQLLILLQRILADSWSEIYNSSSPRITSDRTLRAASFTHGGSPEKSKSDVSEELSSDRGDRKRTLDRKKKKEKEKSPPSSKRTNK